MKSALIVVDVQYEFVEDPRLVPAAEVFLTNLSVILKSFRLLGIPVIHVHYVTEADGRGIMIHHKSTGSKRCLRGTVGAAPHTVAAPTKGESVFAKHTYSAFSSPEFLEGLQRLGIDTLVICGLYSHACVRQTALDALERNFHVQIADNAIATYDALHAQVTKNYLSERGVEYINSLTLSQQLSKPPSLSSPCRTTLQNYPVASISGHWVSHTNEPLVELRNPSRWDEVMGYVPIAETQSIQSAVSSAVEAQGEWKKRPLEERLDVVKKWAQIVESRTDAFLPLMIDEVGKPISACRTELGLLRQSLEVMQKTFREESFERVCKKTSDQLATARRCPRGVVAIIAPWNNPVFLPASKIAAAISLGNGVVWKPALPCARSSMLLQESLEEAGLPSGLVNLVFGGADTSRNLVAHPGIGAVTLTGSVETGRQVAALCGSLLKPLQAELGGNNAAIITENCDLEKVAGQIALAAFAYAGQACTATRRLIVMDSIEEEFMGYLRKSTQALIIGDPHNEDTVIGPVISQTHQEFINHRIAETGENAQVFEVPVPTHLASTGCWLPLRIIRGLDDSAPLVQEETFAPILVVQTAKDLQDAIRLNNAVPHGLISAIFCDDKKTLHTFRDTTDTGIVQLNLPTRNLHMESPFAGWKASGLGPPEHGVWDLDFYTRWQAVNKNPGVQKELGHRDQTQRW